MSDCMNDKCDRDPFESMYAVAVTVDGDFVCNSKCKAEFEKQRNHFFDNIIQDEGRCERWLRGGEESCEQ